MINQVELTKRANKELGNAPKHIKLKFVHWVDQVQEKGIYEVRKISGFHDEPLHGDRKGQRSVRLNKQWRAIYVIINNKIEFIEVQEVTPHEY
ncbi:hypothetical protein [Fluviispira sanaruensis]|uniref:Type II toxin-antitoxin system mRNA interferase toxin, RelE/StbE family n=1 Tax=Fluviispira sanaruensis TaxID=2493639 RepID=A0A4P2VMJ0_FLUSA|nr:hypothetical protein [Fluviispira sanaruensis]BBH53090.1 type II toxin-antitoxin system mRNA interferase toxin, RelE/StbE family [Fluviispira sanaruensis]